MGTEQPKKKKEPGNLKQYGGKNFLQKNPAFSDTISLSTSGPIISMRSVLHFLPIVHCTLSATLKPLTIWVFLAG